MISPSGEPGAATRTPPSLPSTATAAGPRTHLIALPGSGKTSLGVELSPRLGRRALVLTPTGAIQAQWPRGGAPFGSPPTSAHGRAGSVLPDRGHDLPVAVPLDDPNAAIRQLAAARWATERAAATGRGRGGRARRAVMDGRGGRAARPRDRPDHSRG